MTIKEFSFYCNTPDPNEFVIDSGATKHMSPCGNSLINWKAFDKEHYVSTATGDKMMAMGTGDILIHSPAMTNKDQQLVLRDVLYVPQLTHNLVSISTLTSKGYQVTIRGQEIVINQDDVIITGQRLRGRYTLHLQLQRHMDKNRAHLTDVVNTQEDLNIIKEQPNSWKEISTMPRPVQNLWIKAMREEVDNFTRNHTWTPEIPPTDIQPISTRWTFKVKRNENNIVTKIRARLVAKGFEQQYGHQYDESYAPVIKPVTFRTLLVLAAQHDWNIRHIDVDSAFLYGNLKETLFVSAPDGPASLFHPDKTYRLHAAIYGLKQASNEWYKRLKFSLNRQRLVASESDPCLFVTQRDNDRYFVVTHVDDLLIIGKDNSHIDRIVQTLKKEYSIKDLGSIKCYLGMHIQKASSPTSYLINQRDKITRMIEEADNGIHPSKIPILPDYLAQKSEDSSPKITNVKSYQKILGELLYLSNTSRPDIALAAGILGRSGHSPSLADWQAIHRVVGYLKHTQHLTLRLGNLREEDLITYSDADWGGDPLTKMSTSGGCHLYRGSVISWSSTRQRNVTLSTAESEYVAAVEATKETVWIHGLLREIGIRPTLPLQFYCDNQSTIAIVSSMRNKSTTKHIALRMQYMRELVDSGFLMMRHCSTQKMLADALTKPLPHPRHNLLTLQLMSATKSSDEPEEATQ